MELCRFQSSKFDLLNSDVVKKNLWINYLTRFQSSKSNLLNSDDSKGLKKHEKQQRFQSSKSNLLNSDSSLWRARRGAPSEGRFAKPQKSEKFLQNFCTYFIQSNFKNYKKSSKYSCKINRLQR